MFRAGDAHDAGNRTVSRKLQCIDGQEFHGSQVNWIFRFQKHMHESSQAEQNISRFLQGNSTEELKSPVALQQRDADTQFRNENSESNRMCLDFFRQSVSRGQFDQLVAVSKDEDDPPALFSMHPTTLQRFVDTVNAYPGPVQPPLGLVFAVPVTKEALMLAILDHLRGAGTPNLSAAPIGMICLPCTPAEAIKVGVRVGKLEESEWYAALKASAPGIVIGPIASMWTPIPRRPNGELTSAVPQPLPPMPLFN
jgi:hypothetical protein